MINQEQTQKEQEAKQHKGTLIEDLIAIVDERLDYENRCEDYAEMMRRTR